MGGKGSKPQQPRKSFSTLGRSSQRSKFQKSKVQLNQVNKRLKDISPGTEDAEQACADIAQKLESIREELTRDLENVKDHNRAKYEEVAKCLEETERLLASKRSTSAQPHTNEELKQEGVEYEESKTAVSDDSCLETQENGEISVEGVQIRQQSSLRSSETRSAVNSSVKFGVQVMPVQLTNLSQDLLKRSTLPNSPLAKKEFESIRKTFPVDHSSSENLAVSKLDKNMSISTEFLNYVKDPLQEDKTSQSEALRQIEQIGIDVARLEKQLLYFRGTKGDSDYFQLHEQFIRSLIELDNIEAYGNAIVRQEKRNVIQKIRELITILKKLVENDEEGENDNL